ncbi:MAG: hypothetical protein ACTIBX_08510 [Staphylococcus saprophyticus]|uniref:hypothetical protein n=1 Tax=Weissella hellenica TaxID=46256 RepID=UPI0038884F36
MDINIIKKKIKAMKKYINIFSLKKGGDIKHQAPQKSPLVEKFFYETTGIRLKISDDYDFLETDCFIARRYEEQIIFKHVYRDGDIELIAPKPGNQILEFGINYRLFVVRESENKKTWIPIKLYNQESYLEITNSTKNKRFEIIQWKPIKFAITIINSEIIVTPASSNIYIERVLMKFRERPVFKDASTISFSENYKEIYKIARILYTENNEIYIIDAKLK